MSGSLTFVFFLATMLFYVPLAAFILFRTSQARKRIRELQRKPELYHSADVANDAGDMGLPRGGQEPGSEDPEAEAVWAILTRAALVNGQGFSPQWKM